jgi:excinuclease ABC subunit B
MQTAIDETQRRRDKQIAHNEQHNITPQTIKKQVIDIMQVTYGQTSKTGQDSYIAEESTPYAALSMEEASQKIKQLEQEMLVHAQNLEFEQAAKLRDKISLIKESSFGLS